MNVMSVIGSCKDDKGKLYYQGTLEAFEALGYNGDSET